MNGLFSNSTTKYPALEKRIKDFEDKVDEVNNRASRALEQAQTMFSTDHRLITYDVLCDIEEGEVLNLNGIEVTRLPDEGCVFKSVWTADASTSIHLHDFVEHIQLEKGRLWINGLEIINSFEVATNQEHVLTAEKGTVVTLTLHEPS